MAKEDVALRPWALTDTETARDYLKFRDGTNDLMVTRLVNYATAALERRARRNLASRPYTSPVTVAGCTTVSGSKTLITSNSFAAVRVGMYVAVAGVPAGAFVKSVESATSLTLSAQATASAAALSVTFSSDGPLVLSGFAEQDLLIPEGPITELIGVRSRDSDGNLTALDIAGARVRGRFVLLANEAFPDGDLNLVLECVAGYAPGIHDRELDDLESLCLRLVQVMWQDHNDQVGRGSAVTVQGAAIQFIDAAMPKDIAAGVDAYRRWV